MMNCSRCLMKMMMTKISLALAVLLITALLVPSLAYQSTVTIDGQVKDIDAFISEYKSKPLVTQIDMYGTYIDATSYSTLGGWREHPRYYVVFNMFHGRIEWLPWDADGLVPRYK